MRWWYSKEEPSGPVGPARRPEPVPCAVDGCDRTARNGVHCEPHYRRILRNGDPGPAEIKKKAGNGKGGSRFTAKNGYVFVRIPDHPNAYANGVVMEHTVVMAEMLGRPLKKGENVHHKNGDRADNRPENLELWVVSQPKGQRLADQLAWARELITRYGNLPSDITG